MTGRPRIRTLKPELWQDEKVGNLSRDARLLLVGLITMADDEGRLRAMPATILGHAFPYDVDALRKLGRWLDEIEQTGMVLRYEHEGRPYIAFRHWGRHQKPNRPSPSVLPAPPDHVMVTENSVNQSLNGHGAHTNGAVPRVRARPGRSDRIGSELLPPGPPPSGGRRRTREAWKEEVVVWARAVGVEEVGNSTTEAPGTNIVKAYHSSRPWLADDPGGVFRDAAARFYSRALAVGDG